MDASKESSRARAVCRYCGELHPSEFSHCPKTGRALNAGRALVGRTIAGRYRVLALVGEGGMGAVYVAEHLMIGRKVALKRLHPELASDEKAVARFQREARAAAATGHEHIVEVLDLGFGEDGAPFLVMEYLRGKSLAEVLRTERTLDPRRACRIVGQVLNALAAVHRRGIVHRDLKPDNVLLTQRRSDSDWVKVVDFGISKMQKDEGENAMALTRTGVMLGTPFYMSPEQARGMKELDHRVDLYGAGVILYECLTGRLPFDGENYHQLLQQILSGKRKSARELNPAVSAELSAVVDRAIAPDPKDRYPSAREMMLALVPHGAIDPGASMESEPPPMLDFLEHTPQATGLGETTPWNKQRAGDALEATVREQQQAPAREAPAPRESSQGAREMPPPRESQPARESPQLRDSAPKPAPKSRASAPRGLAPEPVALYATPRRFVAQSSDWEERSDARYIARAVAREEPETVPPAAQRPRREEPPKRPPPSGDFDAELTPTDASAGEPTRVKGALVIVALEHIKQRAGALERVLARLSPSLAGQLSGVVLPMAWFSLGDYVEILRAAERELGGAEGTNAVRIGRLTADRELTTTHRLFMQTATPATSVDRIPQLFRTYHRPGKVRVLPNPSGGFRVEAEGLTPDTLAHALALSGFYHRMLELAGAQDVRTSVVSCRERGDEATVTALRWK